MKKDTKEVIIGFIIVIFIGIFLFSNDEVEKDLESKTITTFDSYFKDTTYKELENSLEISFYNDGSAISPAKEIRFSIVDSLEDIQKEELNLEKVKYIFYSDVVDTYGNISEKEQYATITFLMEDINKMNFENITPTQIMSFAFINTRDEELREKLTE